MSTNALHPLTLALSLASPVGARNRLSILIHHRVLPTTDPLQPEVPDCSTFDWQMRLLARHFNVLPLAEAGRRLREGSLPARAAAITFDDGYADNLTHALPILQAHGLPATFFIATGFLDGGRMFNDTLIELARRLPEGRHDLASIGLEQVEVTDAASRRALIRTLIGHFKYQPMLERKHRCETLAAQFGLQLPTDLMLTRAQLRTLHHSTGVEIGAHTCHHPILARLDDAQAREEIVAGKQALETLLEQPVRLFAYPNGRPGKDYLPQHVAMVREAGFDLAVSTAPAAADRHADPLQLPRFTPWDGTPLRFGLRLLHTLLRRPA